MLSIHNMPGKQHRKSTAQKSAIIGDPIPEQTLLSISDLPKRPRGRTPLAQQVFVAPEPDKILSMNDIVPRVKIARTMAEQQARLRTTSRIKRKTPKLGPKIFADYVSNGLWKGRRCFIIGGGPSVKKLDLSALKEELTIGINRAYELLEPSILYGVDGQLFGWAERGELGEESKRKFNEYKGYKVWMALHRMFPSDFYLIDVDDSQGYKIGTTKKLAFKNNSGYGAINLAAALGANPIYLIGFDMIGNKQGKQKWWHNGYPVDYGEGVYKRYIETIGKFAPVLKKNGIEVINLNPNSALRCFAFDDYTKVIRKKPSIPKDAIKYMPKPNMITAITPTGDRPLPLALCRRWMRMQTVQPDQWIIVDDGKKPAEPFPEADYIRRNPQPGEPPFTLNLNLKAAVPYIKGGKILIIEDDEYYAPKYVETMAQELDDFEVAGIQQSKYYHLATGGYVQIGNVAHASLAQTGFRSSFLPTFKRALAAEQTTYLDMRLWKAATAENRGHLFIDTPDSLYVGMKGLQGRHGIGRGHDPKMYGANFDIERNILKKWIPKDYKVYVDIAQGKLTEANYQDYFPDITGITVCYNTKDLIERAYTSVRKFHPDMPIIIIDGSDATNPCAQYVKSLESDLTTVISLGYNIGHGRGMHMGINRAKTPYVLIFDSDIEMLKSPVDAMLDIMESDTFGVGWIEHTDYDGYGVGARKDHEAESMPYLHPYFQLINVANYRKYHPYVHHGAPCYLTMLDIYKRGLSDKVLKDFPGLGHSAGKDYGWEGKPREFIRHDVRGTRNMRKKKGLPEIEQGWIKNKELV